MRTQVGVFLFILFIGILTPVVFIESQVSYAVPSAEAADGNQAIKKDGTSDSQAQPSGDTALYNYAKLGSSLMVYLVLSLVLEMALTVVFNWRLFIKLFEGQGLKAPVAILFAAFIVWNYDLDIMRDVLNALKMYDCQGTKCSPWEMSIVGRIVTAFLLAGGSAGFTNLLAKLGIRNPFERKEKVAEVAAA